MKYKLYPYISFGSLLWPYVLGMLMYFSQCHQINKEEKSINKPTEVKVFSGTNSPQKDYALSFYFELYLTFKAILVFSHYQKEKDMSVDLHFSNIKFYKHDRFFNIMKRREASRVNDNREKGMIYPNSILTDFIKIHIPELLPGYKLFFHEKLNTY